MQAYVAHSATDFTEIRIQGVARKPLVEVSLEPINLVSQDSPAPTNHSFDIRVVRSVDLTGHWVCILKNVLPGRKHVVVISDGRNATADDTITFTIVPLGINDLGSRRLRIGILADPHVNLDSYNGKRLYGSANMLLKRYSSKLVGSHDVDCIVLPGDICDTGLPEELDIAADILRPLHSRVPVYAVIGNHEEDPCQFTKVLLPEHPLGYYSVTLSGVHLILLATNSQNSLNDRDPQWDDGYQILYNAQTIVDLLHAFPAVKAVICGHKNVPSALVDDYGLLHTLSPQLIQVPCGYDVFDIHENGLVRSVYEIEETKLQQASRRAAGEDEAKARSGKEEHRTFKHMWPE